MRSPTVIAFIAVALSSCDGSTDKSKPTDKAAPKAAAKSAAGDAKAGKGKAADSKAADGKAADGKAADGTPAAEVASPKPEREWLVWYGDGTKWETEWIGDVAGETKTLARRKALVHTSGPALFQIARRDVDAKIETCVCMDADMGPPEDCQQTGTVAHPGLVAVDLKTSKARGLVNPSSDVVFGEIYGIQLEVTGGVDGRLFVRRMDSGYYCGVHQSVGGGDTLFDLGSPDDAEWPELKFPKSVREAAARWAPDGSFPSMYKLFDECDGELSFDEFVAGADKYWDGVAMSLASGKPQVTWGFGADVYYVCSADYLSHGEANTGLIAEAAPLGLGGPLPEGLARGLTKLADKEVVGWGELKLGADREAMLAKFSAVDETPWPSPEAKVTESKPTADPGHAKAKLNEGRKKARAHDYAGAIAAFDAAIAADATMARAWGERCYARLLDGQFAGAKKDCDQALKLGDKPRFKASVHYNLGLIAEKQGKTAAAKKAYRASLDLRPNEEVQKAHDAL